MTAIRHTLQRDLFDPIDERLVNVIHVIDGRKKKPYFLCISVTTQHPIAVRIFQVKQAQASGLFQKKNSWQLREAKVVDGINPRKAILYFEITFDKVYRFSVANQSDKDLFISQLYKLCNRYLLAQRPDFVNVSLPVDDLNFGANVPHVTTENSETVSQQDEEIDGYNPVNHKEESDFRRLLAKCQMSIGEAEKFAEYLNRELSMLDGANIQAIMSGEEQIAELMDRIDQAIEQATFLEKTLDSYDQLLAHVRDGVETMEEKDTLIRTHANNRKRLMEELETFVSALNLSPEHEAILADCNLSDPMKITRTSQAVLALQKCMKSKVPFGMEKMKAYTERMTLLHQLSDNFAEKLVAHLSALFRNLVNSHNGASNGLPRHDYVYTPLKPFADFTLWLKMSVPDGYRMVLERYISAFKDVYRREMAQFFDGLKQHVRVNTFERKPTVVRSSHSSDRILRAPLTVPDQASNEGDSFRNLIETILMEIEPVVTAEQKFCIWFFHISSDLMSSIETSSNDSGSLGTPEKRLERQFNDHLRSILGQLFEPLDGHLQDFVAHCEKANSGYLMLLLAILSNRALGIQDSGMYLSTVLGKISVILKRRFDIFMETQMQSFSDTRQQKRTKIGVLSNLNSFEDLAQQAEIAFAGSQRRGDLDRWYAPLLAAIFEGIERAAEDSNSKSPPSIVRMENYHYLFSLLSQLKITCLDQQRKEAKQRYQAALDAYVKEYMGKPMERLQTFFEQIEACIEQGMKAEEIGYQQAFNKQELRKALTAYSVKEVNKGLANLFKKVQKHISDEGTLLQVVWRNMQDEFIQQYKHYEQLIGQCYPNSNMQLEFTISDVLQCFSDIAQQQT